jgi:hypothetical protein
MTRQARLAGEQAEREAREAAAEQERRRLERARADLATLRYRIARPEMAAHMLPWTPSVPDTSDYAASQCQGCGRRFPAVWSRQGHAVEAAQQQPPRDRCVLWALGLPVTSP